MEFVISIPLNSLSLDDIRCIKSNKTDIDELIANIFKNSFKDEVNTKIIVVINDDNMIISSDRDLDGRWHADYYILTGGRIPPVDARGQLCRYFLQKINQLTDSLYKRYGGNL